ncbi:hypothetical protein [Enterovirga aerilata]|uniref:Uncharacterized protein n=1 Tax=Enterovirga aerilata TaxID=2730920 RepID=A0A849IE43_9HYPH|nr:hypothetical protein [Enterovirga sp. DB1703]NNM74719.1 hypothetical protein [Enterovirga sp. DB1703]
MTSSLCPSALAGMRDEDAAVFAEAARWFEVYILVRATNPHSLPYMSKEGYSAKRLDCKAKTADLDVILNGRLYKTAGLVVDPNMVGFAAFKGGKHAKAVEEWGKFAPKVAAGIYGPDGRPTKTFYPQGGQYGVQMDPDHIHFGCVMFSSGSLITAATYIHGDYDLYAIVNVDNPLDTIFVTETRLGEKHVRSKELFDVQNYVNRRFGRPMVLHGDQEKYSAHSDEEVYVFFPDERSPRVLSGKLAIERFYETTLGGRKTGGKDAMLEPAGGLWQRVR